MVTATMGTIPTEADETGPTYRTTHKRSWEDESDAREVTVRVLRDTDRDVLLVEQEFKHATSISEFWIIDDSTLRAKKPLRVYRDVALKAAIGAGYSEIEECRLA